LVVAVMLAGVVLWALVWGIAHRSAAIRGDQRPEVAARPDDGPAATSAARARGRAVARLRTYLRGARTFVPPGELRGPPAPPEPAPVVTTHHPRRLEHGASKLTDRRPGKPADGDRLGRELSKRIATAEEGAERCLDRWAELDDSLQSGVVLAFTLDAQGLQEVWIQDRSDVPSGPLKCIADAVYPVDWGGLTDAPVKVTIKIRYESGDAAATDGAGA